MPVQPYSSGRSVLRSALQAGHTKAETARLNLSGMESEGYVAREAHESSIVLNGVTLGVEISEIRQRVSESLMGRIRTQNNKVAASKVNDQYSQKMSNLFGKKGSKDTLAHSGREIFDVSKLLAASPQDTSLKVKLINSFQKHISKINKQAQNIQSLRQETEMDTRESIDQINALLTEISEHNKNISTHNYKGDNSSLDYIDKRRVALQKLSNFIAIDESAFNIMDRHNLEVKDINGNVLVQNDRHVSFTMEKTYFFHAQTKGETLYCQSLSGREINYSDELQKIDQEGALKRLIDLRDQILPKMQQQLDSYTSSFIDQFNAQHNKGIGLSLSDKLSSSTTIPDYNSETGTSTISSESILSGRGTLRLNILDQNSKELKGYLDIELTDNMSMGDIINQINSSEFATNFGITAEINGEGQFVLQTSYPNGGLSLSSGQAGTEPFITSGDFFNSSKSYGASHFFGFNNLFESSKHSLGQNSDGISENITLRNDIGNDYQKLACGQLPPNTEIDSIALNIGDLRNLEIMSSLFSANIEFKSNSLISREVTTLEHYSESSITFAVSFEVEATNSLKKEEFLMEGLSRQAKDISGVDQQEELQNLVENMTHATYLVKAMKLLNDMDNLIREL
ncbi:MAG: hypothetical protein C0432_03690 [Candidatus Puniceispirillum sp.]|nr:hypothetical protein [Candidatus Pelagibacter sp.]MBA4283377.1 hypothetical protein [Candidatus Puniceispirillum sp.]